MRLIAATSQHVVVDDLLSGAELGDLRNVLVGLQYQEIRTSTPFPVWRLEDGRQLQGPKFVHELVIADPTHGLHSFSCAIDHCLQTDEVEQTIGRKGDTWDELVFFPWVYGRGVSLSLHTDGDDYSGAFTFYFHEHWEIRWGGWLTLVDLNEREFDLRDFDSGRDSYTNGMGTVIFPRPNRAVFLAGDAAHLISRIDATAGDRTRLSISGFFKRKV